jgi:hypothetical protein
MEYYLSGIDGYLPAVVGYLLIAPRCRPPVRVPPRKISIPVPDAAFIAKVGEESRLGAIAKHQALNVNWRVLTRTHQPPRAQGNRQDHDHNRHPNECVAGQASGRRVQGLVLQTRDDHGVADPDWR